MTVQPDTPAALAFLGAFAPEGPWCLTAIAPDRSKIETRTFHPGQQSELTEWLEQHNGRRNIYFAVNPPMRDVRKKAEKTDVACVTHLHVDLDPRAGENIAQEQARIRALLTGHLPAEVPPPTIVIFSGGGYQAFWKLDSPIPVNGDIALAEEAERYNIHLAAVLGGDCCHDISRIMRLPGTANLPDAKKAKRGRKPALAELVEFEERRVYSIEQFRAAPPPLGAGAKGVAHDAPAGGRLEIDGDLKPATISDLSELDQWDLPDRVKVIINQGRHPDEPKQGDNSRSAWLFDAVCQLVRAGVPEESILGIITDPTWSISESVLEHGRRALAYALRQIERARVEVADPMLANMNARHAVLEQEGGKTRVLSWERTELDYSREVPVLQSFDDFRNRYMNRLVEVGTDPKTGLPVKMPLGKWWLQHPQRRQYLALRFLPGHPTEADGYLNMWRGFAVEPRQGDWSLMERHVREVLAGGDESSAGYILHWSAWAVQNPGAPAEVALVLKGGRGTGKGTFARALKRLHGQHGLQVTSPMQLTGRFNAHLRDCCLLFADEAIAPGDRAAESVLKGLITEPELTIEGKGVNAIQTRNRLHIVMASNEEWVVPAGIDERRFAVFEVAPARAQEHDYFAAIEAQLVGGGLAAMLHDLLALDLDGWHPRQDVPQTAALRAQKDLSLSAEDQFILGLLEEAALPGPGPRRPARTRFSNDHLKEPGLYTIMRQGSPELRNRSDHRLGKILKRWGCERWSNGGARGWTFPPLGEMRAKWDERIGTREWGPETGWVGEEVQNVPF